MKKEFSKLLLAGLGLATLTREKAEELVNELVSKGEITKGEASSFLSDLIKKGDKTKKELREIVRKETSNIFKEVNVASQKDIEALKNKVSRLETKLKQK